MESLNPFDDQQQRSLVLRNVQQQYRLWPDFRVTPPDWAIVFGPAARTECAEWLEQHWQDIPPVATRKA
ncbi:MbtH family protein [Serratia ureilytica]|uniref:MbtH family protein n=1 Tax=Serratia ureilytica TaxID=300181 RepID=UPI001D189A67|nr:MbtH family NRPS accessory protein [Serratia ureilytica]MCC4106619.1 MbtH family protein [Serratia ureilytica]